MSAEPQIRSYDNGVAKASADALRHHKLIASDQICTFSRSVDAIREAAAHAPESALTSSEYGGLPSIIARLRAQAAALEELLPARAIQNKAA